MHDVVRSFAKYMARQESLVLVQAASVGDTGLIRRLCVEQTIPVEEWGTFLEKQKSLRTLMIMSGTMIRIGDFVGSLSCLRVLHIKSAESGSLVHFLCQLKHLRYLHLEDTDISMLPDDIHKMKFLQQISLIDCSELNHLPSNIVKLEQLRFLNISGSNVTVVPKGFGQLKTLRRLYGFPAYMEIGNGGWCSLQEIGPLTQLRDLILSGLGNVSASSSWAQNDTISIKEHSLRYLELRCGSSGAGIPGDETERQQQQQRAVEVFQDFVCPPSCIEDLRIRGYFGCRLPNWMMAQAMEVESFQSLRYLMLNDLPCCTQLPDGLCLLPILELLRIEDAPAINRIGAEFLASSAAFPKLTNLILIGLCEWEEWEWGKDVAMAAMPDLEKLTVKNCKLSCLPPGLASSQRHALRTLNIYGLSRLTYVENFPSVVKLDVFGCHELKRISGFSRLQKIRIVRCPNLELLEGVPALDSLHLEDTDMETLPKYLPDVNPRYLWLRCSKELCESLSPDSPEHDKIEHIRNHQIYY